MDRLRVSVTDLEAFRLFRLNEDATVEDFLARLRRETPPTPAMMAGTAFHKALERASEGEAETLEADGWRFLIACDADLALPPVREVKVERVFAVDGCEVTLVGVADAVHGGIVYDHKLSARFDAERYLTGLQWRCYLPLFGARRFVWNVFEARETAERERMVVAVHHLSADTYPAIEEDVTAALREFVAFVRDAAPERLAA